MILRIAACDDNKDEISSLLNLIKEIMKEYSISYYIWEFTSGKDMNIMNYKKYITGQKSVSRSKNIND